MIVTLVSIDCFSQGTKNVKDSLMLIINKIESKYSEPCVEDTGRINAYNLLGEQIYLNMRDSALALWQHALEISSNLLAIGPNSEVSFKIKKYMANSLINIGTLNAVYGDTTIGMKKVLEGVKILEALNLENDIATAESNIGIIYLHRKNFSEALKYFNKCLKIKEKLNDKDGICISYINIGTVKYNMSDFKKASEYFNNALNIAIRIDNHLAKFTAYQNLADISTINGNYNEAIEYTKSGLKECEKIDYQEGKLNMVGRLASYYDKIGDGLNSIKYYKELIKISSTLKDSLQVARSFNTLGLRYEMQADIKNALDSYAKALRIFEKIKDTLHIASCLNNLAFVYSEQGDYDKSLDYYKLSLAFREHRKDTAGMIISYNNIGINYRNMAENCLNKILKDSLYGLAIENYRKSLAFSEYINQNEGIAGTTGNLGYIYSQLDNTNNKDSILNIAWDYLIKGLNKSQELDDKLSSAYTMIKLGQVCIKQKKYNQLKYYAKNSYNLSKNLGDVELSKRAAALMKEVALLEENYQSAYKYFNEEITFKDSLISEKNYRETQKQIAQYEYGLKSAIDSLEFSNELKIKNFELDQVNKEKKVQRIIIYVVVIGLSMVLIFSIMLLKLLRNKKQANILLTEKNEKISTQKEEIATQRDLLYKQKAAILESLHYAKKIQEAVLPPGPYINEIFSEILILYKPKDIVSGDFYWVRQINEYRIIIVADCTGHGVPGALMSMLAISLINEIIQKREITQANQALNEISRQITISLRQRGQQGDTKDGMDVSICVVDNKNKKMQFSGAHNPIYIIQNTNDGVILKEIKADKMAVGFNYGLEKSFTNNTLQLSDGDTIYMFTDGYIDQFGGSENKKFSSKNFKKLILDIQSQRLYQQKDILDQTLISWMNGKEQIDDILVIGFKI
jgi:serine phosphatase RsbU (regulator of sigma subunit)/Tfp pilus assembly protein PilF